MENKPLVSICIPNYNCGYNLEHCLDSVLHQTYPNIEVLISDNNSTDNSYEIAYAYKKKLEEKGVYCHLNNNKHRVGNDTNSKIAAQKSEGEFVYVLSSNDAIKPEFVDKCVSVFEEYPSVGMVICNREELDENGVISKQIPFYNTSCIINSEEQSTVFMMDDIAIPAQRMVRKGIIVKTNQYQRTWNVAKDWYDNFLYACFGDVAYLKDDLVQHCAQTRNETNESEKRLMEVFEYYQLINAFVDLAKSCGMQKPILRYEEAIAHIGDICLGYTVRMLCDSQFIAAKRYILLAPVMNPRIVDDVRYIQLKEIINMTDGAEARKKAIAFKDMNNLARVKSYDPPDGSTLLKF